MNNDSLKDRFALTFRPSDSRRLIAGKESILHCHHYNARLQNSIESVPVIDGAGIIRSSAEFVFADQIRNAFKKGDTEETRLQVAAGLYAHLGYGNIDFSALPKGEIRTSSSHFVEGWRCGIQGKRPMVCTFTEGYLQGTLHAVFGDNVDVRETHCMAGGADACVFRIEKNRMSPFTNFATSPASLQPAAQEVVGALKGNIDDQKILDALVAMPIVGNKVGLIPAFNVYLASTPQDFYNLISIRFVEEMSKHDLHDVARNLLVQVAEICGMNTFRGIMNSAEWDGLVKPMLKDKKDRLFALIAISNALGWGRWFATQHDSETMLSLRCINGYEASGYTEFRGQAKSAQCFMLTGVSAGMMELIYGFGSLDERFGQYFPKESTCRCTGAETCDFQVNQVV